MASGSGRIYCEPNPWEIWPIQFAAEAGVECAYCFYPCDFGSPCKPRTTPGEIALTLTQGETAQRMVEVSLGDSCSPTFLTTAPWLSVSAEHVGWAQWRAVLDIDSDGLAPGYHRAWMRVEEECFGCTSVVLELLPSGTGVGEELATPSTWGRVKTVYR
jgi:hypothetical protein